MRSYLKGIVGFIGLTLVALFIQVIFTDSTFDETILGKVISIFASIFYYFYSFLFSYITIPLLVFIILSTISLYSIFKFLVTNLLSVSDNKSNSNILASDYLNYTQDYIFGLNWYWRYDSDGKPDYDYLNPRCPNCSISFHSESLQLNRIQCYKCKYETELNPSDLGITYYSGCSWNDIIEAVKREINRKLFTGEYKNSIKQNHNQSSDNS